MELHELTDDAHRQLERRRGKHGRYHPTPLWRQLLDLQLDQMLKVTVPADVTSPSNLRLKVARAAQKRGLKGHSTTDPDDASSYWVWFEAEEQAEGSEPRVYLAARFERHEQINGYAFHLLRLPVKVVSRWHNPASNAEIMKPLESLTEIERRRCALRDVWDLKRATHFILFTPGGRSGGCYVEFGWALAQGFPVSIVGPRTNVFTHFGDIHCYGTFDELLAAWQAELTEALA